MKLSPEGLRYLRVEVLGMSQTELATELGVTRYAVSKWENGAEPIDRRTDLAVTFLCLRLYGHV